MLQHMIVPSPLALLYQSSIHLKLKAASTGNMRIKVVRFRKIVKAYTNRFQD